MNTGSRNTIAAILPRGAMLTGIALIAVLLATGGSAYHDALCYQRAAILDGQLWRMLTATFVHLNWSHTLMNVVALLVIQGLFGALLDNRVWLLLTLVCSTAISLALLVLHPEVGVYVGLSGVLHGYFTAGAWTDRHLHPRTTAVLLLLVGCKLLWEQLYGPLPGSSALAGGTIIVDAHLYGAVSGLVVAGLLTAPATQTKPGSDPGSC